MEKSTTKIDVIMTYCRATLNDNTFAEHVKFFTASEK